MTYTELLKITDKATTEKIEALYAKVCKASGKINAPAVDRWDYEDALDELYNVLTDLAEAGVITADEADDVIAELEEEG